MFCKCERPLVANQRSVIMSDRSHSCKRMFVNIGLCVKLLAFGRYQPYASCAAHGRSFPTARLQLCERSDILRGPLAGFTNVRTLLCNRSLQLSHFITRRDTPLVIGLTNHSLIYSFHVPEHSMEHSHSDSGLRPETLSACE